MTLSIKSQNRRFYTKIIIEDSEHKILRSCIGSLSEIRLGGGKTDIKQAPKLSDLNDDELSGYAAIGAGLAGLEENIPDLAAGTGQADSL
jgi:hypothetical protein